MMTMMSYDSNINDDDNNDDEKDGDDKNDNINVDDVDDEIVYHTVCHKSHHI